MSLKIICGRAGTGKSKYCFDEIAKRIKSEKKIYMITPEQFSFTAEKKLLEVLDSSAVIGAEVLSFARIGYRVMQEVGSMTKTNLSGSGKAMMFYDIVRKYHKQLTFLGKKDENIEVIDSLITELKKHNITLDKLKEQIENTKEISLKMKLQDICYIYEMFQKQMADEYIDENDILTILKEKLPESKMFNDAVIYIDEFAGFTTQEYEVIAKLLKVAKQVVITICSDEDRESLNPDTDIFYSNKMTIAKLYDLAKENDIEIEPSTLLSDIKRFESKELLHLEKNLYEVRYKDLKEEMQDIKLFLANNYYEEIEKIANKIIEQVKSKNLRYSDIAILTKNMDTYSSIAKAIFAKYQIPIFMDEKKGLSQNLLAQYVLAIFEIYARSWSHESVFQYLKLGFCDIDGKELYELENYCTKWGIKGKKWHQEDWNYGAWDEESKNKVDRFNQIRKEIVDPLINLKDAITKEQTVKEITKLFYEFLVNMQIDQKIKQKSSNLEKLGYIELSNEYMTSWKIMMDLLDELVLVFGDQKVGFEHFYQLLKTGLQNSSLGKIPATIDCVMMGDVERTRSHDVKVLYIIGLNDGVFPSVQTEEGFLNDKDRSYLKEAGVELAKSTVEKIYDDNFNIYKAFTTAKEKLYLSYSSSDLEGKALRPSILLSRLKKIFPSLIEQSSQEESKEFYIKQEAFEALLQKLNSLIEGKNIDSVWFDLYQYFKQDSQYEDILKRSINGMFYSNIPEVIRKDLTEKLYGTTLHTTVSRLEKYQSCPFSFYLKYGLKLKEQETFQIRTLDTGSFMHDVIDEFFTMIFEKNSDIKQMEEDQVRKIVYEIIEDKLGLKQNYLLTSTPKFKALTNKLKRVILQSILYIVEGLKKTDFKVIGNEVEFKKGHKYEPIVLSLEDGKKVEITGKIDRIDLAKDQNGEYLRIIDYKSSVKNVDLNEVVAGLQIQLLTYLDAACKIEERMPAGVLYYSLIDPIIKSKRSMSQEEIEKEIKKRFKMNGLILADVNVVKMMDKTLEKGSSDVIPVYIDKEGNISKGKSNVVDQKQFQILQKYVKTTIRKIAKEIVKGKIDLKPYYESKTKKTPCQYCEYHSICQFNPGFCNNQYRIIPQMTKEEALLQMQDELDKESM